MRQVRTVRDVENSVRFWTEGVGFELLWHSDPGTSAMAAVGLPGAGWHLELVAGEAGSVPSDPLVLYLGAPPSPDWVRTIEVHGGLTVPLHGYWAEDIGFMDPEGYLLILSSRSWTGSHLVGEHQQQAEDTQQQDRGAEE